MYRSVFAVKSLRNVDILSLLRLCFVCAFFLAGASLWKFETFRFVISGSSKSSDASKAAEQPSTLPTCVNVPAPQSSGANNMSAAPAGSSNNNDAEPEGLAAYSTALGVTLAIGCSLLVLNVLIFAGVFYQRDRTRLQVSSNRPSFLPRNRSQSSASYVNLEPCNFIERRKPNPHDWHFRHVEHIWPIRNTLCPSWRPPWQGT